MKVTPKYVQHEGGYQLCDVCGDCIVNGQYCWELGGVRVHRLCRQAGRGKNWVPLGWRRIIKAYEPIAQGAIFTTLWRDQEEQMLAVVALETHYQRERQQKVVSIEAEGIAEEAEEVEEPKPFLLDFEQEILMTERTRGRSAFCRGRTEAACIEEARRTQAESVAEARKLKAESERMREARRTT